MISWINDWFPEEFISVLVAYMHDDILKVCVGFRCDEGKWNACSIRDEECKELSNVIAWTLLPSEPKIED